MPLAEGRRLPRPQVIRSNLPLARRSIKPNKFGAGRGPVPGGGAQTTPPLSVGANFRIRSTARRLATTIGSPSASGRAPAPRPPTTTTRTFSLTSPCVWFSCQLVMLQVKGANLKFRILSVGRFCIGTNLPELFASKRTELFVADLGGHPRLGSASL